MTAKRSAETQVRYMKMVLTNAQRALGYVERPETRPGYMSEDFLRQLARDVGRQIAEVKSHRIARRGAK